MEPPSAKHAATESQPGKETGRRLPGRAGNLRQSRLGPKKAASPAPPLVSSTPPPISSPIAATSAPATTTPSPTASTVGRAVPTTSSTAPTFMRPLVPQGAGWGSNPPNFASANQRCPNSWIYPPGGFLNMINQPQAEGENFHLVGQTFAFNPMSPPPPPNAYGTGTFHHVNQSSSTNNVVHIDIDKEDTNEAKKRAKKRFWTTEEETRLASAWLNVSKDPIRGNDKKFETFWKEIIEEFNTKGDGKRRREVNQLKIHWSCLKSSITDFNDAWNHIGRTHTSGYSYDMLEEEAQKLYEVRFGNRFQLVHWWKILKEEPKWCAQFEEKEKGKNEIHNVPQEQERPIDREAAKAERSGKRKKDNIMEGFVILGENIEKIIKVQQDRKIECEKVTEAQIKISNANLKAATEEKEARMFEVYNSLLKQDTSQMTEDQKANRDKALLKLQEKLFGD